MKAILLTSSALLLASGFAAAQAQDDACPAEIDAFTRDYDEAMATVDSGEALSSSEQADLASLTRTAEAQYQAGNLDSCMEAIARARLLLETAIAPTAIDPRQLVGMEVRNAADEYLGEIDGLTLDPNSGRIAYVLVEHGGFLGIGDNLYPVPWQAVTWTPGADSLLLDVEETQLENGPQDIEGDPTAQERRAWMLSVHDYYGVQPYWQTGIPNMAGGQSAGGEAQNGAAGDTEGDTAGAEAGTEAAGGASEAQTGESGSGDAAPADSAAPEGGGADAETQAQAAGQPDATEALKVRIDELEARVQTLSEQGLGDEVRQTVEKLQTRVQELSESGAGEDVRAAVDDLQQRVQALAESEPGQEIRSAVSQLQAQVQELAQSEPGQEIRDSVARLASQVRQLAGGGAATGGTAGFAADDGEAPANEPAAAQTQATEPQNGDGGETQAGAQAEPQPEAPAQTEATGETGGTAESGSVITVAPEDIRVIEPGGAEAGEAAGMEPAGEATTQESASTGSEAQGDAAEASGATGQQSDAAEGEPAATGANDVQQDSEASAAEAAPTEQEATSGQTGPASGDQTDTAQAGQPDGVEPCETIIARLQEDLARAEEAGLATEQAGNELQSAQAMLNHDSQALCRAAVKRAQAALAEQGFEPEQQN